MIYILVMVAIVATAVLALVYLFSIRPKQLARLGAVEVPGDDVIELPAGEVLVTYEDAERWKHADRPEPGPGFSIAVSEDGGEALVEMHPPATDTIYRSSRRNRIPYGRLELPAAGRYRVVTRINAGVSSPRVTFG